MFSFEWTINVGNILTVIGLVFALWGGAMRAYYVIDKRIEKFETKLTFHAEMLSSHTARFFLNEERLVELAGDMQRVIGWIEMMREWDGRGRRQGDNT